MGKIHFPFVAVVLAFLVGGCASHPYWLTGHTSDYSQVFVGQGSSDGVTSSFSFVLEPSGIGCRGGGNQFGGDWSNSFECDDNRKASFPIDVDTKWQEADSVWHGQGALSDGTLFSWIEANSKTQVDNRLAQFQEEARRRSSSPQTMAAVPKPVPVATPTPPPAASRPAVKAAIQSMFPQSPVSVIYPKGENRPDDIAVIIGNADYAKLAMDIPDVVPAYADAESIKRYVTQALGVREGNIIDLRDATGSKMVEVFGSDKDYRGQLFDWVKPGSSRVFVYYAGHGAPAGVDGSALLVPSDANAARIELSGYPLATLYANLGKVPAQSITVVLEACFSGASQAGSVVSKASPINIKAKIPPVPANITVIAAGAPNQLASWEEDSSHGLFTKYFLMGMSGGADAKPYGDANGSVDYSELDAYLKGTLTYYARRYYGRDQTAQIVIGRAN
ncbi:MAG: caspase family protein [Rhodospirillales bacterium]|nr:caspase family protein [Rhodospirillales bacterium]